MKTAQYWHKLESGIIHCDLCPHGCNIADGKHGICRVRSAVDGELKAAGYGYISSAGVDPIEKKPLHHFYPGSQVFSIGGWGCNLACQFCQNWQISQDFQPEGLAHDPEEIIRKAVSSRSIGIAYTYNEPFINFEFVKDCAVLARKAGLANVLVTNGFVQPDPAAELIPLIDAMNIDIKSMEDSFYMKLCRARLQPVLDFAEQAVKGGSHVEITNLIIPTQNDSPELLEGLAVWMRDHLGKGVPLHLSAYHPTYKMKIAATPAETLEKAYAITKPHLSYVYVGNLRTKNGQNTLCPKCGQILIERDVYTVDVVGLDNDKCRKCGSPSGIIMKPRRQ